MSNTLRTVSPVDGRIYVERPLEAAAGIERALESAVRAQMAWAALPLASRCKMLSRAVDAFVAKGAEIATEITWQMGRPIRHAPGEIRGFEERARYMLSVAATALAPVDPGEKIGFKRQIKRVPLGVVAVVAPWNYPYLTAVNAVLPALIAGNAVVLKHSHQTPLCAERFLEAFTAAEVPAGVFQYLPLSHEATARLMADSRNFGRFCNRWPRARRQGPRLRASRCQHGARDRNADRRRILQRRPILLRHQAHLCRSSPLR
jgi:acyl-CoA reductase-like NAD-dependent aldehyde dehydrogenase